MPRVATKSVARTRRKTSAGPRSAIKMTTATQPASTTRRRNIRQPEVVEKMVLGAIQKLHDERASDSFRASIAEIVTNFDGRYRRHPSRAGIYRAIDRLVEQGEFSVSRVGDRGHFTYSFGSPPTSAVASPVTTVAKAATTSGRRRRTHSTETVALAPASTGDIATQNGHLVLSLPLVALMTEDETLEEEIARKTKQLAERVEGRRQALLMLDKRLGLDMTKAETIAAAEAEAKVEASQGVAV